MLGRADLEKNSGDVSGVAEEVLPIGVEGSEGRLMGLGATRRGFFTGETMPVSWIGRFPGGLNGAADVDSAEPGDLSEPGTRYSKGT